MAMLDVHARQPNAAVRSARRLKAEGKIDAGITALREAISRDLTDTEAFDLLADLLVESRASVDALAVTSEGLLRSPDSQTLRRRFVELFAAARITPRPGMAPDLFRTLIGIVGPQAGRALREQWVMPQDIAQPICDLIHHDPDLPPLPPIPPIGSLTAAAACTFLQSSPARARFNHGLLAAVLECGLVTRPELEQALGRIRRAALAAALGDALPTADVPELMPFLVRLASWAFHAEYAAAIDAVEERAAFNLLQRWRDVSITTDSAPMIAVVAAYLPLHCTLVDDDLHRVSANSRLSDLIREQVWEPRAEARLRTTFPQIGSLRDSVSIAVRSQYEDNPYPRWRRMSARPTPTTLRNFLESRFAGEIRLDSSEGDASAILVAGCGSGLHPISTALRFPSARIVALDLSTASLAHAARNTQEMDIGNIEYVQGDILSVGEIGMRFDLIECIGVLHHMANPHLGLRKLTANLRAGGLIHLGLYSRHARQHIRLAREFAASRGFGTDLAGIRRCRQAIMSLPMDDPIRHVLRNYDFYSASGCRDMILHAQEHQMTLPEIRVMLEECRLELLGFDGIPPRLQRAYLERNPTDPAFRSWDALSAFEQIEPQLFAGMYHLWAYARMT